MMIIKQRKKDEYCIVHGVIHTDARLYEMCDYCLQHKYWMCPRTVYYRYGFAKKDVLMCDDCHKIEREFHEFRLIAVVTESKAYEAICQTIREKSFLLPYEQQETQEQPEENGIVGAKNYYEAVRLAYQNNECSFLIIQ